MTKSETLHKFWSSFGLDAYPSNAVPSDVTLPYMTYTKGFSPSGYSATVHIYYYTESEAIPDSKAEEICKALRHGGIQLRWDEGTLWLTLEDPEWFSAEDAQDQAMKHRIVNVSIMDTSH